MKWYEKRQEEYLESFCQENDIVCYQNTGCNISPYDFYVISFESLKKELEKGYISILRSSLGTLVLTVRLKKSPIVDLDFFSVKFGECIVCTENCLIQNNCNASAKSKDDLRIDCFGEICCKSVYNAFECSEEWIPYQELLYELAKHFIHYPEDYPCTKTC